MESQEIDRPHGEINFYQKRSTLEKLLINFTIIVLLGLIVLHSLRNSFENLLEDAKEPMEISFQHNLDSLVAAVPTRITHAEYLLLYNKVNMLHKEKNEYEYFFRTYGKNNYALLSLFPILSVITAILGFYVAQKGWAGSNEHLKAYFILLTAFTTIVGIYPSVYNQENLINQSLKGFNQIDKLEKQIFHYGYTAPYLYEDSISTIKLINRINYVESKLPELSFNMSKVEPKIPLTDDLGGM